MVDQSVPVEDHELTDHEAATDWLHGQPYAEWSAGPRRGVPGACE